jgi:hypothetical protein
MPLEDWIQHCGVARFLYDWQTIIAGALALLAASLTIRATKRSTDREIEGSQAQIETTVRLERERVSNELETLRRSLAVELRTHTTRALGAYRGLQELSESGGSITARMLESKSRVTDPIIYPANAGKIGLLGAEAMDVVIFYDLLEIARDGVARLVSSRTPDDISPRVLVGPAQTFLAACSYARQILPRLGTGDPSHDAQDEALIQQINAALAANRT